MDRSVLEYGQWSNLRCVRHFALARWGDFKSVVCPHCNTSGSHYWRKAELRWKCSACRKCFGVTSGTIFSKHRLTLQTILAGIFLWATGAAGQPSLEARRMLGIKTYNAVFMLFGKLREAIRRGYMTGLISGVVEADGAHASGHGASIRRGKPLGKPKKSDEERNKEIMLAQKERDARREAERKAFVQAALAAGATVDPEYGFVYPPSRRIVLTLRQRARAARGKGASVTRVAVARAENPEAVEAFIDKNVAVPETILATDSSNAYSSKGREFFEHVTVNHSETLVGPNGEHINNSEGFTARQDRSEAGVYVNLEPKYLTDYAAETAFRDDHRRLSPGELADLVLHYALNVGFSQDWRGFKQGKHREFEYMVPESAPAKASGPPKMQRGKAPRKTRPPR